MRPSFIGSSPYHGHAAAYKSACGAGARTPSAGTCVRSPSTPSFPTPWRASAARAASSSAPRPAPARPRGCRPRSSTRALPGTATSSSSSRGGSRHGRPRRSSPASVAAWLATRSATACGSTNAVAHTPASGSLPKASSVDSSPGAAEIRRAAEAIGALAATHDFDVLTLHGDQPLDVQERALRSGSRRRVVLATNVAETALTVEGVTTVIDSGLARVARLDPRHGINVLRVQPISRASAEQRAGRAGRLAPGRCLRLWSRAEHAGRRAAETPEVLRLDLTRVALELHAWALADARRLRWLDPPPPHAIERAERLLAQLGALEPVGGAVTPTGRRVLALPAEPRLARMLVEAERTGAGLDGALLAALASERDILARGEAFADFPPGSSDLELRARLFEDAARRRFAADACRALGLDPGAVRAVERARRQLARLLDATNAATPEPGCLPRGTHRAA